MKGGIQSAGKVTHRAKEIRNFPRNDCDWTNRHRIFHHLTPWIRALGSIQRKADLEGFQLYNE